MSSRLIEECFEIELLADFAIACYTLITIKIGTTLIVFDPYAINTEDLKHIRLGEVNLIRMRRPLWGTGNVSSYIHKLEIN